MTMIKSCCWPLTLSTLLFAFYFLSIINDFSPPDPKRFCLVGTAFASDKSNDDFETSSKSTVGPKDETKENIIQVSLRKESSLLRKGQKQFEVGIEYQKKSDEIPPFLQDNNRRASLPLIFRLGVLEKLNIFFALPLTYSYREITEQGSTGSSSTFNIGDFNAGISWQFFSERLNWPELIGTIQFLAPTGTDPYGENGLEADTGTGHWALSGGLQLVKTSDPIVIFGGINYLHQFESEFFGQDIQPGDTVEINFGLSFAANDNLSISGEAIAAYQADAAIDGNRIGGSDKEPYFLRLSVTSRWISNTFLSPFFTFGLNDDADYYQVGIALIRRWD